MISEPVKLIGKRLGFTLTALQLISKRLGFTLTALQLSIGAGRSIGDKRDRRQRLERAAQSGHILIAAAGLIEQGDEQLLLVGSLRL